MNASLKLRSRNVAGQYVVANSAGRFFQTPSSFLDRYDNGKLSDEDIEFLNRYFYQPQDELGKNATLFAKARRKTSVANLEYLILVPTLRCNLNCSYCQVSRANEFAQGYDWGDSTLARVTELIRGFTGPALKIEFQGGEPTLRPDLMNAVIEAGNHIQNFSIVICTNLQSLNDDILSLFNQENVQISTSLDGAPATHQSQRTKDQALTSEFEKNLNLLLDRYGPEKISALPTVDPTNPPVPEELIEAFVKRGFRSIYLRPINFQGFARKQHPASLDHTEAWRLYYEKFIYHLIERNWANQSDIVEETYFSQILSRIFRPGQDRHVDLRNPNPIGVDYVVVDFDGKVYPTDEARMLTRSGIIDLSIGDIETGWDTPERQALHDVSTNAHDPVCQKCVYQPYCGRDIVDDISRYGRIDLPRDETYFCRRHLAIFDLAFSLIYSKDESVQYSLRHWLGLSGAEITLGETL